jgi:hypothetical protein
MSDIDPTIGRRTATDTRQHINMAVDFFTNHKLGHVTDPVERLAVRGLLGHSIAVARRLGSDGHVIPEEVVAELVLPPELGKILIADGSWHQADHGCTRCPQPRLHHVYVHDFLEHHRSAEQERRTLEARRTSGSQNAQRRWADHEPVKAPKTAQRGPGRPRTRPLPPPRPVTTEEAPVDANGTVHLVAVDLAGTEPILDHPAERKARSRKGRPARTEPVVFDPIVIELCDHFADWRARNDPNGKRPKVTERWLNSCRLMIEVDKREPENIRRAIDYSQSDEFCLIWIQAMPKLREEYARLQARAKLDRNRAAKKNGGSASPPAAVSVPGMNGMLARQMQAKQNGMIKGAQ